MFFEKLGLVKLTDFGFSNKFSPGQKLETFCGSLAYSAPEILLGDSYDAPAVGKPTAYESFDSPILIHLCIPQTFGHWESSCTCWYAGRRLSRRPTTLKL